ERQYRHINRAPSAFRGLEGRSDHRPARGRPGTLSLGTAEGGGPAGAADELRRYGQSSPNVRAQGPQRIRRARVREKCSRAGLEETRRGEQELRPSSGGISRQRQGVERVLPIGS